MIEDEFKNILDREDFPEAVKQYYSETISFLKEFTNYDARLIVRSFSLTKREIKDIVVIANLLKQAVTFLRCNRSFGITSDNYNSNVPT